jgi:glycosyltransferase involved in cell wall biosynthesis
MKPERILRRIRLRLAPTGSRRDRWYRDIMRSWSRARRSSPVSLLSRLLPSFLARPLKEYSRRRKAAAAAPFRDEIRKIAQAHPQVEHTLIFPPSLDWQIQLFQRPQQLALALARRGALVFYLQNPKHDGAEAIERIQERMYLCRLPVEAFADFQKPFIYILTWNRGYTAAFQDPRIIYDYVDELEVFEGYTTQMIQDHRKLVQEAELVLTTAERLHRQVAPLRPDALLCPNGVEYERFSPAKQFTEGRTPADMAPILDAGRPVIGYYGALALWFDYDLMSALAARRADLSFVLIGPDYDSTLPPRFLDLPNVYWLGVKPYSELPSYLSCFDAATIPFKLSGITHSTSPLKLFEYMAGGKPVVITPMRESMRYPGVLVAEGIDEFSARLDQALELKNDPAYLAAIDAVARENTWEARARQILEAL